MAASLQTKPLKYHRIADVMREQLTTLPAGSRLPSERELAEQFDCHVLTVRKSLASLVEEGRIERRMGSGTFVADSPEEEPAVAAAVPTRQTGAVGTAIGALALAETDRYGQQVIQALGRMAISRGLDLRVSWTQVLDESALEQVATMQKAGVGSLVLPWFPHNQLHAVAAFVRDCPVPVSLPILIPGFEENCFEHPDCFGRSTLNNTGSLVHYFHALGHRRIALLGPSDASDPILQAKLSAYACTVSALGLDHHCGLIGPTSTDVDALAERWRSDGDLAVISYDDTHALRFMTAMHKIGLSAPDDFVIMGSNNTEACRTCDPPLSSLCQDFDYIGGWLLRSAQGLAAGEVNQSKSPPPYRVVVRASCGAADRLEDQFLCDMTTRGLNLVVEEPVISSYYGTVS